MRQLDFTHSRITFDRTTRGPAQRNMGTFEGTVMRIYERRSYPRIDMAVVRFTQRNGRAIETRLPTWKLSLIEKVVR